LDEREAASRASPRLALLLGLITLEDAAAVATRAMRVFAVSGIASPPQILQAGGVIGEVPQELGDRVIRGRGLGSARFVAVARWHVVKLLDRTSFVKQLDTS
jgi:hypothetical protein